MKRSRTSLRGLAAASTVIALTVSALAGVPSAAANEVDSAGAGVADPMVTGPIALTSKIGDLAHGYPFLSTDYDLAGHGYVEEEFFIDGEATSYLADGVTDATVLSTGHHYKTRMVVRRPADPADFNGTVIAEWINVTSQWDQEVDWFQTHEHLVRNGYAWVGVSAQQVGVHAATGLKVWSPQRYGSLDLTDGGTVTDDSISFDVFSQAVKAVRDPVGTAPLGPLTARQVIATGHSQSASRLWSYVNSVNPLARVVDAVVLHGGGGLMRSDIDTPVFKLNSETDVANGARSGRVEQPDTDLVRTWEVAGASHGDWKLVLDYGRLRRRDIEFFGLSRYPPACALPSGSRVPQHMVQGTVYDLVAAWVADGTLPPSAPPIGRTDTQPATVVRDDHGLSVGGIRLAQQELPTRVNTGENTGSGFCTLYGSSVPVDEATLAEWYPDEDVYVSEVVATTKAAVDAGYVTDEFASDPSWYTDVIELAEGMVESGALRANIGNLIVDRAQRALDAADHADWKAADRWMRQAYGHADHQVRDEASRASLTRSVAAVRGIIDLARQ